jgi:hypothetical protein
MAMLSRTGSVSSEIAICGSAVVMAVESICCMMIAEATISARILELVSLGCKPEDMFGETPTRSKKLACQDATMKGHGVAGACTTAWTAARDPAAYGRP